MTLFPFVAGEVADDIAVDGGAVVEISEGVSIGTVSVYVGLLGGCFEGCGVEGAETLKVCAGGC